MERGSDYLCLTDGAPYTISECAPFGMHQNTTMLHGAKERKSKNIAMGIDTGGIVCYVSYADRDWPYPPTYHTPITICFGYTYPIALYLDKCRKPHAVRTAKGLPFEGREVLKWRIHCITTAIVGYGRTVYTVQPIATMS